MQYELQPKDGSPCAFAGQYVQDGYPEAFQRFVTGLSGNGVDDAVDLGPVAINYGGLVMALVIAFHQDTPPAGQDLFAVGSEHNESFRLQRMGTGRLRLFKRNGGVHTAEIQTQAQFLLAGREHRVVCGFNPQSGVFIMADGDDSFFGGGAGVTDTKWPVMDNARAWLFADASGNSSATDQAVSVRCVEVWTGSIPSMEELRKLPALPPMSGTLEVTSAADARGVISGTYAGERGGVAVPPDWRLARG